MYMRPTIGAWHTDTHKRGPQDKRNRAHRTEADRAIEAQRCEVSDGVGDERTGGDLSPHPD